MPLIDQSYFVGEINIPNTGNPAVLERLNFFIAKYEEEFLRYLMGSDLYAAYKTGIAADPPLAIWSDLRDGKSYTVSDRPYIWEGLYNPSLKTSPIANYVYYWWMRRDNTPSNDDAKKQSQYLNERDESMRDAWNKMLESVQSFIWFLDNNVGLYPLWANVDGRYTLKAFAPINLLNL